MPNAYDALADLAADPGFRCPACNGPLLVVIDDEGMEICCESCTRFDVTDRDDG